MRQVFKLLLWQQLTLAILLCTPTAAYTQTTGQDVVQRYALEDYLPVSRIRDGLPSGNVRAIAQDATGFIWIGSEEGLARYDGHDFVHYDFSADSTERFVTSMFLDASGVLWIGSGSGLYSYNSQADKIEKVEIDGAPGESIYTVFSDDKGRLWVSYTTGGLSVQTSGTWKHDPKFPVVVAIEQSKEGYWCATEDDGLLLLKDFGEAIRTYSLVEGNNPEEDHRYLSSSALTDILVNDGVVWIATVDAGLNRLSISTGKVDVFESSDERRSLIADNIRTLALDHDGQLWVGTDDGLSLFDEENNEFYQFRSDSRDPKSLGHNYLTSSFVDSSGVIWLGQFALGASKFYPPARKIQLFHTYLTGGQTPTCFSFDSKGVLWVGTYNGGLWSFDWKNGTRTGIIALENEEDVVDLNGDWISSITSVGDALWLTTQGSGLVYYEPYTGAFRRYGTENSEIASNELSSLVRADNGDFWIGSLGAGLIRFSPKTETFDSWGAGEISELTSDYLLSVIIENNSKALWMGSADGLVRLDLGTYDSVSYNHTKGDPTSLPGAQVNCMLQVGTTMWVGTGDGLGSLDMKTGEVKRYQAPQGLSNATVLGLLADSEYIWITTNGGGLQRLDPKTDTFRTFLVGDGMQGREYSSGGFLRTDDGTLLIAGAEGFNIFKSADVDHTEVIGPPVITNVEIANKPAPLKGASWTTSKIEMAHSSGIVKFDFAALGFVAPEQLRFRYRLKGLGVDWQEVGAEQRFASYTNLDDGDYEFQVMAQDRQGNWSEPTIVKLHVTPPLWKTWWALMLYVVFAALIVAAYLKYQREKLAAAKQQNRLLAVENDLELTGAVQSGFLPQDSMLVREEFALLGYYKPAESCSGDWWWHEMQADGRCSLLVGDVTGHGPGPAMVTAAVATAYRVQSRYTASMAERLKVLNDEVLKVSKGKYQMTLTAFTVDVQTGAYEIHSAGGLPVMSHEAQGSNVKSIPCRGTPLGTEEPVIGRHTGELKPGDRVLLYTDGIPEIEMANGRQIGMRRFAKLLGETSTIAIPLASKHIVTSAETHLEANPQDDDWTFVIFEWNGAGQGFTKLPTTPAE